ncbi:MAG: lipocalin-like domain-containing protein [Pseudomonadota bacterium]|nr:lipocalin-like domain-containing protein [Pseudomonadota bacterium]
MLWLVIWTATASGAAGAPASGDTPAAISLPRDHGAHPEQRIEWWYFTGRLQGERLGEAGFQFTLFRTRMPRGDWQRNPSSFTPHQVYMGHAALSRLQDRRHRHAQRISRQYPGFADAAADRLDVRIGDWSLREAQGQWRGSFSVGDDRFELVFDAPFDAVLHGDGGISRKAEEPAFFSHYYSLPRLRVRGEHHDRQGSEPVQGVAWMDHEWSDALLPPGAAGWDWFGLRLDDGSSVMAFRIRAEDGGERYRTATLVGPDGSSRTLGVQEVALEPDGKLWRSPRTGAGYPLRWRLRIAGMTLVVRAVFPEQEMAGMGWGPDYWEGAVTVSGDRAGEGYMELTGYGGPPVAR